MSELEPSERTKSTPIQVALALIDGGDASTVEDSEAVSIVAALSALKQEYSMLNTKKKKKDIQRINELLKELNQRRKPSKMVSTVRRQTKQVWPTSKRPPGAVAIRSLPDDEYEAIVDRIERAFEGEFFDRSELDPLSKRKILFVINDLRKQEAEEANYTGVRDLDRLIAEINAPVKASLQPLRDEITAVKKRIDDLHVEMLQLESDRHKQLNDLMEQRHLELAALIEDQDVAMEEFCLDLPRLDEEVKFTGELLLMRANAKNYALGGDYEAARILHEKADEKEEKERHDAVRRTIRTCNLKRHHFEQIQAREREVFALRSDGMIAKAEAEWEKVFARKQCHMNNLNAKLKHLKEKLRKLTVRKKY